MEMSCQWDVTTAQTRLLSVLPPPTVLDLVTPQAFLLNFPQSSAPLHLTLWFQPLTLTWLICVKVSDWSSCAQFLCSPNHAPSCHAVISFYPRINLIVTPTLKFPKSYFFQDKFCTLQGNIQGPPAIQSATTTRGHSFTSCSLADAFTFLP